MEMAQQLRQLSTLTENPSLAPPPTWQLTIAYNQFQRIQHPLLATNITAYT